MVRLEKITKDNYRECLRLQVAEYQTKFVAPNARSLAKAYVYYDEAMPFAVYNEESMVGYNDITIHREIEQQGDN